MLQTQSELLQSLDPFMFYMYSKWIYIFPWLYHHPNKMLQTLIYCCIFEASLYSLQHQQVIRSRILANLVVIQIHQTHMVAELLLEEPGQAPGARLQQYQMCKLMQLCAGYYRCTEITLSEVATNSMHTHQNRNSFKIITNNKI